MPEEEEEQNIENLLEKNFSNLAKEIDFQEVQEAQRVPKKLDPRKHTPRHIVITLPKIKDKERILKAAREKETVTYKGLFIRLSADFSKKTPNKQTNKKLAGKKGLARSIPSYERQGPTSKIALSSKAFI